MAAGITIKHKRKAGAFANGELAAGEWGLDVTNEAWYFSINGTTVQTLPAGLTQEQVEDFVGAMVSGNTESGITVTYDDAAGKLNFTVTDSPSLGGNAANTYAPLASPALTGTPTAPTAATGTNTTQIASTAYVVSEIASRIASLDVMVYKGALDASANPNYPAADAGHTYRISVAGKIGGASGPNVQAGDIIIANADGLSAGNHATVGASWNIIQTNIDGALTTADIGVSVQAYDPELAALAGLTSAADKGIQFTGAGTAGTFDLTAFAKTILDDANAAAVRTTIDAAPTAHTHAAADITSGDLAAARMQTNIASAINAASAATLSNANLTIDGGTL